jgi:hypothetical protein
MSWVLTSFEFQRAAEAWSFSDTMMAVDVRTPSVALLAGGKFIAF